MERKQAALLAQHGEDGAQQVSAHIERERGGIRLNHNLLTTGDQVARDAVNAQKILRGVGEAIGIDLDRVRQMIWHVAQSNVHRMRGVAVRVVR